MNRFLQWIFPAVAALLAAFGVLNAISFHPQGHVALINTFWCCMLLAGFFLAACYKAKQQP